MPTTHIHGYSDHISVKAGDRVKFMVSVEGAESYHAEIVRLINGDANPKGPGPKEEAIATNVTGEYPGRYQPIHAGSHILVDDPGALLNLNDAISLHAFVMPTTPTKGVQGIVTRCDRKRGSGWALTIDDSGRLTFSLGDNSSHSIKVTSPAALMAGVWYSVGASYDRATGRALIHLKTVVNSVNSIVGRVATLPSSPEVPTAGTTGLGGNYEFDVDKLNFTCNSYAVIAGWAATTTGDAYIVDGHYNGKIDRPRVYGRALKADDFDMLAAGREPDSKSLLARWNFSDEISANGISSDEVTDSSGNNLNGRCINAPARAMTGHNWRGREENFTHAPAEYGAIHFHDDDLDDAGWDTCFELVVPATMRSAIYAAKVTAGDAVDYIPFVVRQPPGHATAKIAFLMPTASYMAYSNELLGFAPSASEPVVGHTMVLGSDDVYLYEHPELGLSTYDHHADGSGVCYVSRLRPIPNLRPHHRFVGNVWGLAADLHLVNWLDAKSFAHDVITDEDLHREGTALLAGYKVILTGSHPEYYSSEMLDAMEDYLTSGGRLMYLGGNGFYWITSYHTTKPHRIEVRKGESGSRAWQAKPGEYYHSTTGERGGVWRNRARPPQKLVGVGFAAQGFDRSTYYSRMPDSHDPRARFILEGIAKDELIGDFGLVANGAAGSEIDRYDRSLGTPPDTMLVASSEDHSDNMQRVVEEIYFNYPGTGGTQDPGVRSDICYFTTANGGAVFSSSSIAWSGSLSHNNYDNNVSRMTANVLMRFADDEPLD
jgi:N,N-dimethylformamidase